MEVKILDFWVASRGRIERELEALLDKGWRIAAAWPDASPEPAHEG
jgi:hypothetical protein